MPTFVLTKITIVVGKLRYQSFCSVLFTIAADNRNCCLTKILEKSLTLYIIAAIKRKLPQLLFN